MTLLIRASTRKLDYAMERGYFQVESENEQGKSTRAETRPAAEYWAINGKDLRFIQPEELIDEIALSLVEGVGPIKSTKLIETFGSAQNVINASVRDIESVASIGNALAKKIVEARASFEPNIKDFLEFCDRYGVRILFRDDARYPRRLREIDDAPRIIYARGKLQPRDFYSIAMVGTRAATPYGRNQANLFARGLAERGFTIVSGLALGVDGCCHRGALEVSGRTIAVLANGVARVYPPEHEDLAGRILASGGALLSEYYPLMTPKRGNFPARNRLISGLSVGVIVVESDVSGGSMITARMASEQNRECFAIPGSVESDKSRGCHRLIREGATLVETVDDVIDALPDFELPPGYNSRQKTQSGVGIEPGTLGIGTNELLSIGTRDGAKRKKKNDKPKSSSTPKVVDVPPKESGTLLNATKESVAASENAPSESREAKLPVAPLPELSNEERTLVDALGEEKMQIDYLVQKSGLDASRVLTLIAVLEFKNVLKRSAGCFVERVRVSE